MVRFFRVLMVLALCASPAMAYEQGKMPAPYSGSAEFEKMKSLAGNWEGTSSDSTDKIEVEYKVISNGSAVVETLFPDSSEEMVSIYHDNEQGKLSMTHYCAFGNRPELALDNSGPDRIGLELDPSSNIGAGESHMHHLELNWKDADHITQTWQCYMEGKPHHESVFTLTRVK